MVLSAGRRPGRLGRAPMIAERCLQQRAKMARDERMTDRPRDRSEDADGMRRDLLGHVGRLTWRGGGAQACKHENRSLDNTMTGNPWHNCHAPPQSLPNNTFHSDPAPSQAQPRRANEETNVCMALAPWEPMVAVGPPRRSTTKSHMWPTYTTWKGFGQGFFFYLRNEGASCQRRLGAPNQATASLAAQD